MVLDKTKKNVVVGWPSPYYKETATRQLHFLKKVRERGVLLPLLEVPRGGLVEGETGLFDDILGRLLKGLHIHTLLTEEGFSPSRGNITLSPAKLAGFLRFGGHKPSTTGLLLYGRDVHLIRRVFMLFLGEDVEVFVSVVHSQRCCS